MVCETFHGLHLFYVFEASGDVCESHTCPSHFYWQLSTRSGFLPGDLVLLRDLAPILGLSKKLSTKYRGPFQVLSKDSDLNYTFKMSNSGPRQTTTGHISQLKRYLTGHLVLVLYAFTGLVMPQLCRNVHCKI